MSELVAAFPVGAFTDPQNGNAPIDADEVRANDEAIRGAFNSHDGAAAIHFQGSIVAARPAAGTAGRKWFTSDTFQIFRDNGSSWDEVDYLNKTNGGTVAGAVTFTGAVTSTAGSRTLGATTFSGTISGTAAIFSSTISAAGATLTGGLSGTTASFSSTLSVTGVTTLSGDLVINNASAAIKWTANSTFDITTVAGSSAPMRFGRLATGEAGYIWCSTAAAADTIMTLNQAGDKTLVLGSYMTGGITVAAGGVTVGSTAGAGAAGRIVFHSTDGIQISGRTGSIYDFVVATPAGGYIMRVPTGTANVQMLGSLTTTSTLTSGASVVAAAGSVFAISGRSALSSAVDGNLLISNNAISSFGLLQLGGVSNAFYAIKQGTLGAKPALTVRLADDSDDAGIWCKQLFVSANGISAAGGITSSNSFVSAFTNVLAGGVFMQGGTQVVGARQTGWAAPTGTPTRSTFATGSVTLSVLAEHVKALIDDLTTHGLIGV